MLADCEAGKIDIILTQSLSRFARNTVDTLNVVRRLKELGIEVRFEKENIWTFDSKGEPLITIMSSLAQEESRSISENCTWGQRKRMADGKVSVPFSRFLGYDRGENGELVVNPEQAEIVKRIYTEFLQGATPHTIAAGLTADSIRSPGGKDRWNPKTVQSILQNEKYKGDALLQKCFTEDFLTKKQVKNQGQVPQYYVPATMKPSSRRMYSIWCSGRFRCGSPAPTGTAASGFSPAPFTAGNAAACTAPRCGIPMTSIAG